MIKAINFKDLLLKNQFSNYSRLNVQKKKAKRKIKNEYYKYLFFKVPSDLYKGLQSMVLKVEVKSDALIYINYYMNKQRFIIKKGLRFVTITKNQLENGENILAYKGNINVVNAKLFFKEGYYQESQQYKKNNNLTNLEAASQYLISSIIKEPLESPFKNSCYTIFDYDNNCFRMPCWLWSDAPVVSALLELSAVSNKKRYKKKAISIGEVFIKNRIRSRENTCYGAIISRYRHYGNSPYPFDCLIGPNDTSFSVKWALLPLYHYTGDKKYLDYAKHALDWVVNCIYDNDFVPSHYYLEQKKWEKKAFVDTGFIPDGLLDYWALFPENNKYRDAAIHFMNRFIKQYKLKSGFFGQNYSPHNGTSKNIFTRGQGWVLEGLLALYKHTQLKCFESETKALAYKIIQEQNSDGSWSYLLGKKYPHDKIKRKTGVCEKATALLSYLLIDLYNLCKDERFLKASRPAVKWCENNISFKNTPGFGGIASRSIASGITSLPFLKVATGYANSFYVLAKLRLNSLEVKNLK